MTAIAPASFEALRHDDEAGEYWSARELCPALGYDRWENFAQAIVRAELSINASGYQSPDHVRGAAKMIQIGNGAERPHVDYRLTRFGAYMVAMNGDPRKPEIAAAQTYFAVKTRQAELAPALALPSRRELAQMVIDSETARELAEARVAELEPAADAWTALADAAGDYSLREAAEVLSRDGGISTGQNRLLKFLREVRWVDSKGMPYQSQIEIGRLAVRTRTYDDPITGEPKLATQLRVTAKGVDAVYKLMTTPKPAPLRSVGAS